MRLPVLATCILALCATAASAQTADPQYATAAEVAAIVNNAKTKINAETPTFNTPTLKTPGYTVVTEYHARAGNANVHETEAEFIYVVEGEGTLILGGNLVGAKRPNPTNQTGTGVDGGTTHQAKAGDMIMVPVNTPHFWSAIAKPVTLISLHVPAAKN